VTGALQTVVLVAIVAGLGIAAFCLLNAWTKD
jgi:multisubunit Na+/H+ antiporter MnhC subunit